MAKLTKPIYAAAITDTTSTVLYTAPAGGAIVNFVQITHLGANKDNTYDFWVVEDANVKGDDYRISRDQEIGKSDINESQQVPFGNWFLNEGDFVEIQFAGTGINHAVHLNVVEEAP